MKKRDYMVIGIGALCMAITLIVGMTYAYWRLSRVQEDVNVINTSCFNIAFQEGDAITLNDAYPISDEQGLEQIPYTFTIENTCDTWAAYQINLESLELGSTNALPDNYVHTDLQEGTKSVINSVLNNDLTTIKTLDDAKSAYKLYTGMLKPDESKTYNLRIWMDKDVGLVSDSMNATFQAKITINFSATTDPMANAGTLIALTGADDTSDFWNYRDSITKVVFENKLEAKETTPELTWNVSEEQNKSVMAYLVQNEDDSTYTLYIQGNGGVYANSDSSWLFYGFTNLTEIEGLEYLDTSKVTNMSSMFSGCSALTATLNIKLNEITTYSNVFEDAATAEGTIITVNYTAENESLVESIIATKGDNSNVVKGSLIEA